MKRSLFGYGTTTKPLAKEGGWDIYDDKFTQISQDEFGNNLLPCEKFDAQKSELEIPSPGFLPTHKLIQKSQNLISEYDYFFDNFPPSVWISGTNGKTTTTQMLQYLLANRGSCEGGNIGTPLALLDKNAPLWILETSSFTMYYTKKAYPNVYLLLPITQDHLDWHKDFKEYEDAKLSPLKRMEKGSLAILPKKYKHIKTNAHCIFYENEEDLAYEFGINLHDIHIKEPFLFDALLALACEYVLYQSISIDKINSFKIDHHKMEEFKDKKGRLWVNDTKGTNDDATIAALKRYKNRKIHLILGGVDKGLDMDELLKYLKTLHVTIYAIGDTTEKITNLAKNLNLHVTPSKDIKTAVETINKSLKIGEVALLSPATSSFDQFTSYKHRGEFFVKCVDKIS